jgi:hypothetical protein
MSEWIVIKDPSMDDARHAYAGTKLSWLVRFEMRTGDDTMRILPDFNWRNGPEDFVAWMNQIQSKPKS